MLRKVSLVMVLALLMSLVITGPVMAQDEPLEIYFFPGGPEGGPFATVVYNGAVHASEILGDRVEVRYRWSDWSPERMVTQFQEAVAANPDGIAIMGHPGDDALEPHIDEAREQGIIVTSQNTTLPRMEDRYVAEGFGYAGQDLYDSGYMLGEAAVERAGLGEGNRALIWGLLSQPTRGQRTQGAIDAVEAAGVEVDYMEISSEVDADASAGIPVIAGYLAENPDTDLVITDHGALTSTLDVYLETAGMEPGEIYGAGFDLSPATLDAIQSGYVQLVHDQQPFLQGFLPIFQIYLSANYQFSGLHIDTGSGLVHEGNVELLAPLIDEGIR